MIVSGYEIYMLTGGGYAKRKIVGFCFDFQEAKSLVLKLSAENKRKHHCSKAHYAYLDNNWHKVLVSPIESVILAQISAIPFSDNWHTRHHRDCGTKFRGCSPDCPKDHYEKTGNWLCYQNAGTYSTKIGAK